MLLKSKIRLIQKKHTKEKITTRIFYSMLFVSLKKTKTEKKAYSMLVKIKDTCIFYFNKQGLFVSFKSTKKILKA